MKVQWHAVGRKQSRRTGSHHSLTIFFSPYTGACHQQSIVMWSQQTRSCSSPQLHQTVSPNLTLVRQFGNQIYKIGYGLRFDLILFVDSKFSCLFYSLLREKYLKKILVVVFPRFYGKRNKNYIPSHSGFFCIRCLCLQWSAAYGCTRK